MKNKIFREKSLERISSPEQLTDYIKVTRPGVWIILVAIIILLVSLLIWGVYGTLPDMVSLNGVSENGVVTCYTDNISNISEGLYAEVDGIEGTVTHVSTIPLSLNEVSEIYAEDYTLHMLDVKDWNYEITINAEGIPDGLVKVMIMGNAIHPISFLIDGVTS